MSAEIDPRGFPDVSELGRRLRAREFSAVELAGASLARLHDEGRRLNAVVTLTPEVALAQAAQADEELAAGIDRGLLHGIPYGAKDLLAVRGYPTTWGAAPFRDRELADDAAVVERLRAAGAVLVAKLAMVELAGGFGYDQPDAALTGPGRNAWDADRWSGGSSSGSGAAVAAGCVPLAIGSETWGSIEVPAALNGVTGFRPTYGLVSRRGAMALSWTLDKIGPLAHTVADCEVALAAMAGHDPGDRSSLQRPPFRPDARREGFRFATLDFAGAAIEPDVLARFEAALGAFREIGSVETIRLPQFPFDAAARIVLSAEAAAAFEEFVESGSSVDLAAPEDRIGLLDGLAIPASDYLRALRIRRKAMAALGELLAPFDAMITPAYPRVAPSLTRRFSEEPNDPAARPIGGAANFCGLPGLFLPMGPGRDGLPTAVTLTGRADEDAAVLAAGIAYQARTDWHLQHPLRRGGYLGEQRTETH